MSRITEFMAAFAPLVAGRSQHSAGPFDRKKLKQRGVTCTIDCWDVANAAQLLADGIPERVLSFVPLPDAKIKSSARGDYLSSECLYEDGVSIRILEAENKLHQTGWMLGPGSRMLIYIDVQYAPVGAEA